MTEFVPGIKLPPYSVEAEQSVIGGLLLDNQRMADVADVVKADDFFRRDHRLIFTAMLTLDAANRPADPVTVAELLSSQRLLDEAGGLTYLGQLARETPSAANVRAYAQIVRDRSIRRRILKAGTHLQGLAYDAETTQQLVADAQASVLDAVDASPATDPEHVGEALTAWMGGLDARAHRGDGMVGMSTSLVALDENTGGLEPGDLIILAGRPSMGKTAAALGIASAAAVKRGEPTLVFSLEQPKRQLLDRLMADLAEIDHDHLRKGKLEESDYPKITRAAETLSKSKLYIDDRGGQTITELRAKARRVKHRHGLALIVVDYLQLLQVEGRRENRATEVSEMSAGLKALAKELHVPVIALCQLNRAVESRDDKRPRMSDLRESGGIEQDADLILMLYRQAAYDPSFLLPTVTELIVAKQRNGPIGTLYAHFFPKHMRFRDADQDSIRQYNALLHTPKPRRRARHPDDDVPSGRDRAAGDVGG